MPLSVDKSFLSIQINDMRGPQPCGTPGCLPQCEPPTTLKKWAGLWTSGHLCGFCPQACCLDRGLQSVCERVDGKEHDTGLDIRHALRETSVKNQGMGAFFFENLKAALSS